MIAILRAVYSSVPIATSDQNRVVFEKYDGSWIKTGRRTLLFQQAKLRRRPTTPDQLEIANGAATQFPCFTPVEDSYIAAIARRHRARSGLAKRPLTNDSSRAGPGWADKPPSRTSRKRSSRRSLA